MAVAIDLFNPSGENGAHYYKRIYISTTGQIIGINQSDTTVVLSNVDLVTGVATNVTNIATNAAANLTKKPAAAATVADTTFVTSGITFDIAASETLWIEGDILISSAAAGALDMDFKFVMAETATATGSITVGGAEIYAETDLETAVIVNCAATGTLTSIHIKALVTNDATAQTVDFQFAHNTSATDVVTLRATSKLSASRVD